MSIVIHRSRNPKLPQMFFGVFRQLSSFFWAQRSMIWTSRTPVSSPFQPDPRYDEANLVASADQSPENFIEKIYMGINLLIALPTFLYKASWYCFPNNLRWIRISPMPWSGTMVKSFLSCLPNPYQGLGLLVAHDTSSLWWGFSNPQSSIIGEYYKRSLCYIKQKRNDLYHRTTPWYGRNTYPS